MTMAAIFILAASRLNRTALLLSPVALAIVLTYSYTKRFTRWSHLFLGLAMGIAPSAAWIAVRLARSADSSSDRGGALLGRGI